MKTEFMNIYHRFVKTCYICTDNVAVENDLTFQTKRTDDFMEIEWLGVIYTVASHFLEEITLNANTELELVRDSGLPFYEERANKPVKFKQSFGMSIAVHSDTVPEFTGFASRFRLNPTTKAVRSDCICSIQDLMREGCSCGAVKRYQSKGIL